MWKGYIFCYDDTTFKMEEFSAQAKAYSHPVKPCKTSKIERLTKIQKAPS